MKKPVKYRQQIKRTSALLMLMTFLFVSFFQVFHHHDHQSTFTEKHSITLHKTVKSCEICHYLAHHHAVPTLTAHAFELVKPISFKAVYGGKYNIRFYEFTLQGFSNKGPPAFNS